MNNSKQTKLQQQACAAPLYVLCVFIFFTAVSCQTAKFNFVSEIQEQDTRELDLLELDLLRLRFESSIEEAKKQTAAIEHTIAVQKNKKTVNQNYMAVLYGLEGEFAAITGQTERMRTALGLIQKSGGATVWTSIIASYLENNAVKKIAVLQSPPQTPLLTLKIALAYFDADDYASSVAAFDKAFAGIAPEYVQLYGHQRDAAYQFMLNPPQNMTAKQLFSQKTLTLEQIMYATRDHTPYLNRLIPKKNTPIPEVFALLKAENYFISTAQLFLPFTRAETARFFSHIFAQKTGTAAVTARGDAYKKRGRSPVPDVPLENEHFAYIIFMLEKEIMELPDGRKFFPEEPVSGMDFNKSLEKMTATW